MQHKSVTLPQVQKIPLLPRTLPTLKECIKLKPSLYLKVGKHREKVDRFFFDLMLSECIKNEETHSVSLLLNQLEAEAAEIDQAIKLHCGADVAAIGSKKTTKQHICKICGKVFNKSTALGGHTSKLHSSHPKKEKIMKEKDKTQNRSTNKSKKIKKENLSTPKKQQERSHLKMIVEEPEEP